MSDAPADVPSAVTEAQSIIPPNEWRRRRIRMDIGIAFCFTLSAASWIYGAVWNGINGIVASLAFAGLAGGLGLIANYSWAAKSDDANRNAQIVELIRAMRGNTPQ